jgi:hypothetical protein
MPTTASPIFPQPEMAGIAHLCDAEGPCLSFFLPRHRSGSGSAPMAVRLQTLLREAEETLRLEGILEDDRGQMLAPLYRLSAEPEMQKGTPWGAAIYRNPSLLAGFALEHDNGQGVELMERFQVAPLVEQARSRTLFMLVALTREGAAVYEPGARGLEDLTSEAGVPRMREVEAERGDWNRSPGHAAMGAGGGYGTEAEKEPRRLRDYYAAVDEALRKWRPGTPVVLCAAVAEEALYRMVAQHEGLVENGVGMSPGSGGNLVEMEQRARQLMHAWRSRQELRAVERFGHAGPELRSLGMEEILRAAAGGAVEHLFFQTRERVRGNARRILLGVGPPMLPGSYVCYQEDLVNAAVVETVRHGGAVWPVPPELVPKGGPAAALLRYAC